MVLQRMGPMDLQERLHITTAMEIQLHPQQAQLAQMEHQALGLLVLQFQLQQFP